MRLGMQGVFLAHEVSLSSLGRNKANIWDGIFEKIERCMAG
jgi:hypothetical protein